MNLVPSGIVDRAFRFEPSRSWTLANSDDSYDQLVGLIFRTSSGLHLSGTIVTGVNGVRAGSVYYLGNDGRLSENPPTTGYVVVLGKGIDRGTLLFDPQLPLEQGVFRAMRGEERVARASND